VHDERYSQETLRQRCAEQALEPPDQRLIQRLAKAVELGILHAQRCAHLKQTVIIGQHEKRTLRFQQFRGAIRRQTQDIVDLECVRQCPD
jgi:hypothetical protein